MDQIIAVDDIKKSARSIALRGGTSVECLYPAESHAREIWLHEFHRYVAEPSEDVPA